MLSVTEKINKKTVDIDLKNGEEIAHLINNEDKKVALAISKIIPQIGEAIEKITDSLRMGGRMAYFGSGTSGRIGILDASEMSPTFSVDKSLVQGYVAGGVEAIRCAIECAEDNEDFAIADIKRFNPSSKDVVVGISATGNPLYVIKVLQMAKEVGALTIAISSNPQAKIKDFADIFLNPIIGPEVITGSSRMKAGTAQKMILNMLSTGAMIRLGKTYQNYMIDLQISNKKLHDRAIRFVSEICKVPVSIAEKVLDEAKNVKVACVMILHNCSKQKAEDLLNRKNGILRKVI